VRSSWTVDLRVQLLHRTKPSANGKALQWGSKACSQGIREEHLKVLGFDLLRYLTTGKNAATGTVNFRALRGHFTQHGVITGAYIVLNILGISSQI